MLAQRCLRGPELARKMKSASTLTLKHRLKAALLTQSLEAASAIDCSADPLPTFSDPLLGHIRAQVLTKAARHMLRRSPRRVEAVFFDILDQPLVGLPASSSIA